MILLNPITILVAAAIIPAVILLFEIYKYDRLEKESGGLLRSLVLKGIVATALAVVTEKIGIAILGRLFSDDSFIYYVILMYFVVGLSEEGFKYLLLRITTWNSPEFNCRFDGVVYAVFVALGFALWENISYVFSYGLGTALVRAVTAVPGHACFGVFMGTWYGLAKKQQLWGQEDLSVVSRTVAVVLPVLIHGTYDLLATMGNTWIFILFIGVMFAISFSTIKKQSTQDHYL
ncbi:MAG: PrsW family intramembrane metalloprotease [Clostridia bacterium]|jgi:RsiW-degrading membrane proteinase PrsW (M82 family)|nr:PrsW family intramembrane metalloprotease [Clostridia bacterium]